MDKLTSRKHNRLKNHDHIIRNEREYIKALKIYGGESS